MRVEFRVFLKGFVWWCDGVEGVEEFCVNVVDVVGGIVEL